MATAAQKQIKELIKTLKWADEMFARHDTGGDVDIDGITATTRDALEARRADVLCPAKDENGKPCMLAKAHATQPQPSAHVFDQR